MTRTQFISKVAPLFAVTWRRFNGHDFSLGWVLENFKPSALQEKTGQAATEEMQTGGLSQMVWLSNWHAGSPEAGFSLQRGFIWLQYFKKNVMPPFCHHFAIPSSYTQPTLNVHILFLPLYVSLDPNLQ